MPEPEAGEEKRRTTEWRAATTPFLTPIEDPFAEKALPKKG